MNYVILVNSIEGKCWYKAYLQALSICRICEFISNLLHRLLLYAKL